MQEDWYAVKQKKNKLNRLHKNNRTNQYKLLIQVNIIVNRIINSNFKFLQLTQSTIIS